MLYKTIDKILEYKNYWKEKNKCRFEIYLYNNKAIVVFTELKDNPGTPITSYFKELATTVYKELLYDYHFSRVIWIEHYNEDSYKKSKVSNKDKEIKYHRIHLEYENGIFINPKWEYIGKNFKDVINLVKSR